LTSNETPRNAGTVSREIGCRSARHPDAAGGMYFSTLFQTERVVFHQPSLYPFEGRETRRLEAFLASGFRMALELYAGAATIPGAGQPHRNRGERLACGIRS